MSEILKGILRRSPNGRTWLIKLLDTDKSIPASPKQMSAELREMDAQQREEQIVEFTYTGGLAKDIRATGEKFKGSEAESADLTYLIEKDEAAVTPPGGYKHFHNPFNFIPAPPRHPSDERLGDSRPAGHDRYLDEHWTGRISVKLVTKTPLLIPDAAKARPLNASAPKGSDQREHVVYPTRTIRGEPYLPPTSLKGMLRSAYEAITNSRMAVFHGHSSRLAYRMPADDAASDKISPARVEERDGQLGLRIMSARKLPRYSAETTADGRKGEHTAASTKYPNGTLPEHGDPVWVNAGKGKVKRILRRTNDTAPEAGLQKGWACVTGPNIGGKTNERVFVERADDDFIPISDDHRRLWQELVEGYQTIHQREIEKRASKDRSEPQDYLGNVPGRTGWSRHIYLPETRELREGTLCYVEFDQACREKIKAIFPVIISRRLHELPPDRLLDDSLKPAQDIGQLSPADRVFGWASQKGFGAYRGNLRINPVTCDSRSPLAFFDDDSPLSLAILSQPKPQQARFYVASSKHGEKQEDGLEKESAGYLESKGLRGRKVYPHHSHATLSSGYWDDPQQSADKSPRFNGHFREYLRPNIFAPTDDHKPQPNAECAEWKLTASPKRDDQNRSILSWVKPKTQFSFTIDVTNLSPVELGALLWLLELPDDPATGRQRFHRLGGGKPLGFGSVKLVIDWNRTDLRTGQQWREYYSDLNTIQNANANAAQTCIQSYKQAVERVYGKDGPTFEEVTFIAAFLRAAEGFVDGLQVHYPRTRPAWLLDGYPVPPHPEGKSFEWFVENERTSGPKVALPDLANEHGLPILSAE